MKIIDEQLLNELECLEPSVLLECKAGPFVEHEVDGILEIKHTPADLSINKKE